jgi:tetratricopeptide (TPR) repeat protein
MPVDVSKDLDRARRNLERNKLEDAAAAYESVLNEMPGHSEALQALGDLYTRLSQADRAVKYYNMLFDRFFETREENKALAIYTRALKGIQQPPERLARYALLLQKQNRAEDAIEQYSFASELFLARGNQEAALDCLDRVAQLDPDNSARQVAIAELAEQLGKNAIAARGLLRAAQLAEASGEAEAALKMLKKAHELTPTERGPALLCAQALLRHKKDGAAALQMLQPFAKGESDQAFQRTMAEALTFTGALDRARDILAKLPAEQPETASRIFDLADRYLAAHQDIEAMALLQKVQEKMGAAHRESDFIGRLELLADTHAGSVPLAEFCAAAYAQLNRETKYFDALVRLFDLYIAAKDVQHACKAFERLVDIDPYDARNQKRFSQIEAQADPAFAARMRSRLGQTAPQTLEASPAETSSASFPASGEKGNEPTLEDLIVQAEIFLQYSLQTKAVERLQKIGELFPGEEKRNERLRNLYQLANWWP